MNEQSNEAPSKQRYEGTIWKWSAQEELHYLEQQKYVLEFGLRESPISRESLAADASVRYLEEAMVYHLMSKAHADLATHQWFAMKLAPTRYEKDPMGITIIVRLYVQWIRPTEWTGRDPLNSMVK